MQKSLIMCLALGLAGCSSLRDKSMHLSPGLTKKETLEIVGAPELRSFMGSTEVWQYTGFIDFQHCTYLTLWFQGGLLDSLTTTQKETSDSCQSQLQPIHLNSAQ
ncbi:hypothetical protein ACUM5Y_05245 [Marinomonas dokdonensis]|uniref:hypothetical protein n=1 Tax=Marinomonas dokdonensis TaxID=328224 RepID=UPI0040559646